MKPLYYNLQRAVAQLGSALRSGRRGRGFKSRLPDPQCCPTRSVCLVFVLRGHTGILSAMRLRSICLSVGVAVALLAPTFVVPVALAQSSNDPPDADAGLDYAVTPGQDTTGKLDASNTFDTEDRANELAYSWKPITDAYKWIPVTPRGSPRGRTAEFDVPPLKLVNQRGVYHIDFELTVVDTDGASSTDIIRVTLNQPPQAQIALSAKLPHPNPTDANQNGVIDDEEKYTVDAVIDAPLEGGNDANDWDIQEGARLTLTGSSSTSGEENPKLTYTWERRAVRPNNLPVFANSPARTRRQSITIDLPDTLQNNATAYVQYRLVVTNQSGVTDSALVNITVRDQPSAPTVQVSLRSANQPAQVAYQVDPNQLNQPARFVVAPGQAVQLIATAEDKDGTQTRRLSHLWAAGDTGQAAAIQLTQVAPTRRGATSRATYTAPAQLPEDTSAVTQTLTVTVTDDTERTAQTTVTFITANNQAPQAVAPANIISEDGAQGGDDQSGTVQVRGLGIDSADDTLTYQWRFVDAQGNLLDPTDAPVTLVDPTQPTTSFDVPELRGGHLLVHLQLVVTDSWGVFDTDTVTITIFGRNDAPTASAGANQTVVTRTQVTLDATASTDPDPNEQLNYSWAYTGITLNPPARVTPLTPQDSNDLRAFWPTANNEYPTVLTSARSVKPTFLAPKFTHLRSVRLTFTLTVTDSANSTSQDEVHITVVGRFFSGEIDHPDFCRNKSLGGQRTYPHDSTKDGVADVCSLRSTRREAVVRQQALTSLASINRGDFVRQVNQACKGIGDEDYTQYGDKPEDLKKDVCSTGQIAAPPEPPNPEANPKFYSGPVITGPNFCVNFSLGGALTYPHDGDGDGIAEVCALPYTRREAVARQIALDTFASHSQFRGLLAVSCQASAGTQFGGDKPEDLKTDVCATIASTTSQERTGTALPS